MTVARDSWILDPEVVFLNHGSFGACPRAVLDAQQNLRDGMERQPVRFFVRELEPMLDAARAELASFLHADPAELVFVPNATAGVNAVLRSLRFEPGDELLTTTQSYNACRNALDFVARRAGARVVTAALPFPLQDPAEVIDAITAMVTPQTRLALLDHVTSPTGLVLPIEEIVSALAERGVDTLVDGAHAPGMLDLDVPAVGATYYTGNCHKWLCAPKGAGFLWVPRDRQADIRPVTISHGANATRTDRSRFHAEFDWVGTDDPTAYLCVRIALECMAAMLPGGWSELRAHNRALALAARDMLCEALALPPPAPDTMIGSLAAVPLPDGSGEPPRSALYTDPLQDALWQHHRIEVPVVPWPHPPRRLIRVSAQLYNTLDEYRTLASALPSLLAEEVA